MTDRTITVDDTRELEQELDRLATEGYKTRQVDDWSGKAKAKGNGSTWVHILLFLTTIGVGNVIYYLLKRSGADTVEVVVA